MKHSNKYKGEKINPNKELSTAFNNAKTDLERINIIAKKVGLKS